MGRHTTLRLNEALLRRAKAFASRQDLTLTAVMERALTAYLADPAADRKSRVELPAYGTDGKNPGVDLDKTSTLLDIMDGIE